jgi:hypothetical protein
VPNENTLEPGQEVMQRLLLDRVDAEARTAAVRGQHHFVAHALAHEAQPALPFVQLAVARTQVALDAPIRQRMPPARRCHGIGIRNVVALAHDVASPAGSRLS